jgi:T-complex protein 1 subunit delta
VFQRSQVEAKGMVAAQSVVPMMLGGGGNGVANGGSRGGEGSNANASEKSKDVRRSNIAAAKAVSDCVRTSLGPRGMDKMIQTQGGEVIITNDGATILEQMNVEHPAAKMLVALSKAQDTVAGDGTTSVVVICGSLLQATLELLARGLHPSTISDAFAVALEKSIKIIDRMAIPIALTDRPGLVKAASTSLNSKVVAQHASLLAPIAVDAVMRIMTLRTNEMSAGGSSASAAAAAAASASASDGTVGGSDGKGGAAAAGKVGGGVAGAASGANGSAGGEHANGTGSAAADAAAASMARVSGGLTGDAATAAALAQAAAQGSVVDLKNIRTVKKLGGTIDDTEMIDGLILTQGAARGGSASVTRVEKAKVALIQFCLSPPKTDVENSVIVQDYAAMDRILREERQYILAMCKKIKQAGCNVVLIQKSILRDSTTDLSLHFLAKLKIMAVTDIERTEIEFISKSLGCIPIAGIETFTADKLAKVDLVEEVDVGVEKMIKMTGVAPSPRARQTVSILVRGSNQLVLDEAERSLHDAICVVRSIVHKGFLLPGGGAPEAEVSVCLAQQAKSMTGMLAYCVAAYADALDVVPYTLAENAGLNPVEIVTELRRRHAAGDSDAGINVRKGAVTNISDESVVMPYLVFSSALSLATEQVRALLRYVRGGAAGLAAGRSVVPILT